MQDQRQQKTSRPPKQSNRLWGLFAFLLLISAATYFWTVVKQAPHAEWRNVFRPLPWKSEHIVISEAEASWKSSAGDARMELRARYYPSARIKLASTEGKGTLSIRFLDSTGAQIGDRVNVPYDNNQFTAKETPSLQVNGNEITVRLEDGYQAEDLYRLHQVDDKEPLWRIEVDYSPLEHRKRFYLGHISVIPYDL